MKSACAMRRKMPWWMNQAAPIVRKLVTYARYDGHSLRIAWARCADAPAGSEISRTSSVIAIAKTPSLSASIRELSKRPSTPFTPPIRPRSDGGGRSRGQGYFGTDRRRPRLTQVAHDSHDRRRHRRSQHQADGPEQAPRRDRQHEHDDRVQVERCSVGERLNYLLQEPVGEQRDHGHRKCPFGALRTERQQD